MSRFDWLTRGARPVDYARFAFLTLVPMSLLYLSRDGLWALLVSEAEASAHEFRLRASPFAPSLTSPREPQIALQRSRWAAECRDSPSSSPSYRSEIALCMP
jgi:hypothetical protein